MNEEQKDKWVEMMVSGEIPKQDSYTFEEVKYLVNTACVWASQQIEHAIGEAKHEDMAEYCAVCELDNLEEALKGNEEFWEEELLGTSDFIKDYFAHNE